MTVADSNTVTPGLDLRQRRTLAAAVERLVPADELGPGALAAGAHNYIEAALTGPLAHRVADYRDGLDLLDAEALRRHGVGFADATDSVQDAVLRLVEQRPFFELLREHTIEGLLGDPVHGGNRGHIGWTLIGYRRPGLPITAAAQGSVEGRSL